MGMYTYEERLILTSQNARLEGRDEGKIEGKVEGIIEGRAETQLRIAETLLSRKKDTLEQIAQITGITVAQLEKMQ